MTYCYGDDCARFPEGTRRIFSSKSDGATVFKRRKQEATLVSLPEWLD